MFRTNKLATLPALLFSCCIATPASAQYFHDDLADGPTYSHHHHGQCDGYDLDCYRDDYYGHGSHYDYGHVAYPAATLNRHRTLPVNVGSECSYGYGNVNDAISSEPVGGSLGRWQALPNRLADDYQPGFGYEIPIQYQPYKDDNHSWHSHKGHSHDGHSHSENPQQSPFYSERQIPSDQRDLAPPLMPRESQPTLNPRSSQPAREQPFRDDSIRMDTPPPSTFGPSSSAPSNRSIPSQFNTPSSATEGGNSAPSQDGSRRFDTPPPASF